MNKIELTHDEFAFLVSFVSSFIDKSGEKICEMIEDALSCVEVSALKIESFATSVEEAFNEFCDSALGSKKEAAVIRNLIKLTNEREKLPAIYEEMISYSFGENSDETRLLIRRSAKILF